MEALTRENGSVADSGKTTAAPPRFIGHTTRVYVIDPHGGMRPYLPADFRAEDLAADVRLFGSDGIH